MYNANPNYKMDFMILKDVNEHMDGMFQRFSKLLPFRIDFAYRKDTPSSGIPVSTVCVWKYTVYLAKPRRCWRDITG
ncbi:hypothetical protein I5Z76_05249 (plasmid) [Escherichia coli]